MGQREYRRCRICRRHVSEGITVSTRGKCPECAEARQWEATMQMVEHRGPVFEHWRRRVAISVGVVLPEGSDNA